MGEVVPFRVRCESCGRPEAYALRHLNVDDGVIWRNLCLRCLDAGVPIRGAA